MRGDGRIFKRPGSSLWWCAYYLRGKQYRQSTDETDEKRAVKFLQKKLKEVHADQIGARHFIGPQQERITLNEILDDLVEHYKRGGRRGIPREVSPQMQSHLKHLRDYFGPCRAMHIGSKDVERFTVHLKEQKKANATINRSLQLLTQAYRYAVSTDPPKLSRIVRIEKLDESGNRRKGKFSPAEAEAVASSLPPYMTDVARYAYETGSRVGEILHLRWSYRQGNALVIPGKITKSRDQRIMAITPEIQANLDRREKAKVPGCDLIFHNEGHDSRLSQMLALSLRDQWSGSVLLP